MVTREFLQHHEIETTDVVYFGDGREIKPHRALVKRNITQRMVDRYLHGHNITDAQHTAATRFYTDWRLAGIEPRVTVNLMGVGGGGKGDGADHQMDARARHRKALAAIDMYDQGFVIDVVCFDIPVGGETMKNRTTIRTRFDRLRTALDRLVRHYGIS